MVVGLDHFKGTLRINGTQRLALVPSWGSLPLGCQPVGDPVFSRGFWIMTTLQARLFAGRSLHAVRAQEEEARRLRPAPEIPSQRPGGGERLRGQAVADEVR